MTPRQADTPRAFQEAADPPGWYPRGRPNRTRVRSPRNAAGVIVSNTPHNRQPSPGRFTPLLSLHHPHSGAPFPLRTVATVPKGNAMPEALHLSPAVRETVLASLLQIERRLSDLTRSLDRLREANAAARLTEARRAISHAATEVLEGGRY